MYLHTCRYNCSIILFILRFIVLLQYHVCIHVYTCTCRILALFDHIKLILVCCHYAIAISQFNCGQLEQCVTDSQGNDWCSFFSNASTNDFVIIINKNISSATIEDRDVKIHWNTQDIRLEVHTCSNYSMTHVTVLYMNFLQIPTDYQTARDLDIHAVLQENTSPVHVHVEFYSK